MSEMNDYVSRRQMLQALLASGIGLALAACGGSAGPASSAAASAAASPAGKPAAGGASAPAAATTWDELVAAAKKEGKVVVSGPPDPESRAKLPPAFKEKFGIEMEYLGGNSSQLAARLESERAAGQYTIDASVGGSDTFYGTFLANKWLEPLKPALVLPEVTDGSKWKTGSVWFRDPNKDTIVQLFNTVQPMLTLNLQMVKPSDIPNADALLDPKWKGKMCAYDPSVNGAGIAIASAIYVTKGEDFASKLYKGQNVALSRDYEQVANWVAQGSYPIAFAAPYNYLEKYIKSGVKLAQSGSAELPELPDSPSALGGGFGDLGIWTRAPHPNAGRVFANWITSKEGLTIYAQAQTGQGPARTDIDPTWMPSYLLPKPNIKYLDTYDYDFELNYRLKIRDYYNKLLK